MQTRPLGRAPTTLAGDNLIMASFVRMWTREDRLQNATCLDGFRQLL